MLLFFFLATLLGATTAQTGILYPTIINKGELLRLQSDARRSAPRRGDHCKSWKFCVETHSCINWKTVPQECGLFVARYMVGYQYAEDSRVVTAEASKFARSHNKSDNDTWVLDIDETAFSNVPYYYSRGFGVLPFDSEAFNEWVQSAKAPALPTTLRLYQLLQSLEYKIVFLTERREYKRQATESNLLIAGYRSRHKVIHK